MLSIINSKCTVRYSAIPFSLALGAATLFAAPAQADVDLLGIPPGGARIVCVLGSGTITVVNSDDSCNFDDPADSDIATGLSAGNATFNSTLNRTDISTGTLLVNGVTTTFSGGTTGFFSPVTFTGSSVTVNSNSTFGNAATFNALADFNNGITSNTITNSGTINTATLSAGTIVGTSITASGALLVSSSSNIDMGNNVVHF